METEAGMWFVRVPVCKGVRTIHIVNDSELGRADTIIVADGFLACSSIGIRIDVRGNDAAAAKDPYIYRID